MGIRLLLLLSLWATTKGGKDHLGTEFMLGFMDNKLSGSGTDLELFVTTSSNEQASVTVTAPLYDSALLRSVNVTRGNIEKIVLPHQLRGSGVALEGKGVHVQATQEIAVYGINKEVYSTDGFVGLPVDTLGTEYFALTWNYLPEIIVVAVEDNTTISFAFPSPSTPVSFSYEGSSYGNGDTLNVTLDRYQTFHLYQSDSDYTGTCITGDKAFSAFSGNWKVRVRSPGSSRSSSDHLVEQLQPVTSWGKQFVTVTTPDRTTGEYFLVLASEDGTNVTVGDSTSFLVDRAQSHQFFQSSGTTYYIDADKPIQIAMLCTTIDNDGPNGGDPAMTILVPVPLWSADFTWSTVTTPSKDFHNYISVAIRANDTSGLQLDGSTMSASWTAVSGNSEYVTTWVAVSPGAHSLYHSDPSVPFMGIAFGNEQTNSYAYAAGMRLTSINAPCVNSSTVAGDLEDNDCDGRIDEETNNGLDDDGDGSIDEDLAMPPRVDGSWGDWASWGACSVTCTTGTRSRSRACDNPAPSGNGVYCVGSGSESESCDMGVCSINGNWGEWGAWASCSVTCGYGTRSHNRTCDNPAPFNGGDNCTGDSLDSESCFYFCMDLVDDSSQAKLQSTSFLLLASAFLALPLRLLH